MSIFISILCSNQHGGKSVYFLLSNSSSNPSCLQFYFFWIFNFRSISWKAHKILRPRKTLFIPNLLSFNVGDNSHRFSSLSLPFCSKSPPFLVTKNLSTAHPYSLVFHLGFLLIGFCIAELLLILFYFCFPFGFARLGIDTGGGPAPLAQYIFFLSRLIFKKKKKRLGPPLQKA